MIEKQEQILHPRPRQQDYEPEGIIQTARGQNFGQAQRLGAEATPRNDHVKLNPRLQPRIYLRLCEENGVIWHSEMVEKRVGGEFLSRILQTHFRVVFYDVFGGCEVTKMQSSHLNSHRRPHSARENWNFTR